MNIVAERMREIPELTSLLYDLDLLPEQWEGKRDEWKATVISFHMAKLLERARAEYVRKPTCPP